MMACVSKGLHRWLTQRSWLIQETKRQIRLPSNKGIDKEAEEFVSSATGKEDTLARNAVLKEFNRRAV